VNCEGFGRGLFFVLSGYLPGWSKEKHEDTYPSGITVEIQSGYPSVFHRHYNDVLFILISDTTASLCLLFITLYAVNAI
jgi:hypothetical protein